MSTFGEYFRVTTYATAQLTAVTFDSTTDNPSQLWRIALSLGGVYR
jgi:hypothetical protein